MTKEKDHPIWVIILILVGIVWTVEHYVKTDIPLVAILLVVVGIFYLVKSWKKN